MGCNTVILTSVRIQVGHSSFYCVRFEMLNPCLGSQPPLGRRNYRVTP